MRKRFIYLLVGLLVMVVATCNVLTDEPIRGHEIQDGLFDGKWTWVRTDGDGIAGPYVTDSTTTGYSIRYDFDSTTVQTWRDQTLDRKYSYTYTQSADSTKQFLTLRDSSGDTIQYLWKRYTVNTGGRKSAVLVLTNPIPCCDNGFSMYLRRIGIRITPVN